MGITQPFIYFQDEGEGDGRGIVLLLTTGISVGDTISVKPSQIFETPPVILASAFYAASDAFQYFKSYAFVVDYLSSYKPNDFRLQPTEVLHEVINEATKALSYTYDGFEFSLSETERIHARDCIRVASDELSSRAEVDSIEPLARGGYIYLVKAVAPETYYKIGLSKTPVKRIKSMGVKLPFPLKTLHTFPTDNMYAAEKALHERYDNVRVDGEWFELSKQDVADICAIERMDFDEVTA